MMLWLDIDNKKVIRGKYLIPNMPMQVWDDGNEEFLEAVGIYKAIVIDPTFDLGLNNAIEVIDWATKTISYTAQPKSIEVIVPQSITKIQAMEAMSQTDVDTVHNTSMWTVFKALIAQNENANDRWLLAQVLERNDPFVDMLAPALNKTDAQIDELFILGGSL